MSLTDQQKKEITSAFKSAVALATADSVDNHSSCAAFHIEPFNTHWDKQTVDEIIYNVQLYVRTWIVSPLERAFELKMTSVDKQMLLSFHEQQARKLKSEIEKETIEL